MLDNTLEKENNHYDETSNHYQIIHKWSAYVFAALFYIFSLTSLVHNPGLFKFFCIGILFIYTAIMGLMGKFVYLVGYLGHRPKVMRALNGIYGIIGITCMLNAVFIQ
ncbi:MAG: hypothetical protein JXR88_04995 [Clostridia bacterium]|nr:hypothetical protein [Clostridia bacterium]